MLGLTASANSYYPLDGLIYFINKYSIDFDGTDDRIVTDGADTVAQPTTYSFWCKSSFTGANYGVFGHGNTGIGALHFNIGNRPLLYLGGNYWIYFNDIPAQDDGEWHHWVLYVDTNNILNSKLYVDSVLIAHNQTNTTSFTAAYTQSLTIGSDRQVGGNSFEGKIDEFAVFDRELTQAEITRMYNSYYTTNLVQNGTFQEIGAEEVTNGDFSQIGSEEVTNGDFSQIGSELVANGSFSNNANGWTRNNSSWSFSSDKAFYDNSSQNGYIINTSSGNIVQGKIYKVTFEIGVGIAKIGLAAVSAAHLFKPNNNYTNDYSIGNHELYLEALTSSNNGFLIYGFTSGQSFSIDNISVKEVGQDWLLKYSGTGDWSITDKLNFENVNGATRQNSVFVIGKTYKITVDYVFTSGTRLILPYDGSNFDSSTMAITTPSSANGYTYYYTPISNTSLNIYSDGNGNGSVDNITVKEVGQDWTFQDGWNVGENKAIFDGTVVNKGISQEGILTSGKFYKISLDINVLSGTLSSRLRFFDSNTSGTTISNITSSGTYTFYALADKTGFQLISLSDNTAEYTVTNFTFKEVGQHWTFNQDTVAGWSMGDGVAISDGVNYPANLDQYNTLTIGKTYKAKVTVSNMTTGTLSYRLGGSSSNQIINISQNGEYTANGIAGGTGLRLRSQSGFDGSVDNIVVQELKHDATNLMLNAGAYQSASPLITSTKSMEFDGTDTTLEANNELSSGTYSFSAWVKRDTIPSVWQYIVDFRRGNTSSQYVAYNSTGGFGTGTGSDIVYVDGVASSTAPNDTKWHHIVVTGLSVANSSKINIGSRYTGLEAMDGLITEVGVWDRTLTDLEVASLYNQGVPTDLLVNRNNYQSGNPTVFNTKQVDFDGADDFLELGSQSGVLRLADSNGSISAWVKPTLDGDDYQRIVDKSDGTSAANGYAVVVRNPGNNTDGKISCYIDGVTTIESVSLLTALEWSHVLWTWDGTNHKIYINGALNNTSPLNRKPPTDTANMRIGSWNHSTQREFDGKMSQIGIWNEALTADEVSSLYNHGLPIDLTTNQAAYESSSNLVGYWRMGGGTLDSYPLIADQTNATLGSEQIVNGDFATDSDWSGQYNSISNGSLNLVIGDFPYQDTGVVQGKVCKISYEIKSSNDGLLKLAGGANSFPITVINSSVGLHTYYLTTQNNDRGRFILAANGFIGSIDNVSLKEVNGNPAIMTNQTSSDIENGSPYANLVQNGTFDTDSVWVLTSGATISNNKLNINTTAYDFFAIQNNVVDDGKIYKVNFDATISSGSGIIVYLYNVPSNATITSSGNYTFYFTAAGTGIRFRASDTSLVGSIDNVTVEEVNTGLQGYWKMGDGANDEFPVIYDQTNPTNGAELVTNGDFNTTSNWSENGGANAWSIANGKANCVAFASLRYFEQSNALETSGAEKTYKVVFTVSNYIQGILRVNVGGYQTGAAVTSNGTHTQYIAVTNASSNKSVYLQSNANTILSVDNISVKEIQGNPATMTNMVEGNITNQYPLTKIRNYYRMGDGDLDGYPIIQDQTSRNLATIPTTNLIPYSENLTNNFYLSVGLETVTESTTLSPDGVSYGYIITPTSATQTHYFDFKFLQLTTTVGTEIAFSVFVKPNGYNFIQLTPSTGFSPKYQNFELTGGGIIGNGDVNTSKIEKIGDWYRCSITQDATMTNPRFLLITSPSALASRNASFAGNGTDGILAWGYQIEEQSQATAYIKSDGVAAVRKSTTTNLISYSEDFSQSYWQKNSIALEGGQVAPDGTNTAYKVTGTIDTSYLAVLSADTNQRSIYAKTVSGTGTVNLLGDNSGFTVTNEWQRFEYNPISTTYNFAVDFRNGTNVTEVLIWGYQLEEQTQAETYAPTKGIPVTIDLFTENNYGTMTNMSANDIVIDTPGVS